MQGLENDSFWLFLIFCFWELDSCIFTCSRRKAATWRLSISSSTPPRAGLAEARREQVPPNQQTVGRGVVDICRVDLAAREAASLKSAGKMPQGVHCCRSETPQIEKELSQSDTRGTCCTMCTVKLSVSVSECLVRMDYEHVA